jgi:hypothetical protein
VDSYYRDRNIGLDSVTWPAILAEFSIVKLESRKSILYDRQVWLWHPVQDTTAGRWQVLRGRCPSRASSTPVVHLALCTDLH